MMSATTIWDWSSANRAISTMGQCPYRYAEAGVPEEMCIIVSGTRWSVRAQSYRVECATG